MKVKLGDVVLIDPTTQLKQGTMAKFVSMDKLEPYQKEIDNYEAKEFKSGTKFINGDTLVARITPCLENGKTAFVDFLDGGEVGGGSTEFIVLREKPGVTDKNFIYYLAISPKFRECAIQAMIGTSGRQRVQNDVLAQLELDPPNLQTQKKIAEILTALDAKIHLNRETNRTLESLATTLFQKTFLNNPEKETWATVTIADLGTIVTGKTPSKANADFFGTDFPFLKVPDMHGKSVVIQTEDGLSTLGAESQKNKFIPKWSTCVSCIATVGVVSLAGEELQTNQQINSIIPKNESYAFYNYFTMKEKSEYIKTLASSGSATPNLNMGAFSKIPVTLPPVEILTDFHEKVQPLFAQIESNNQQSQTLTHLRQTLLPKLLSGEIEV